MSLNTPTPPPVPQGWVAQWDEEYKRFFYVETATGQSQWEHPEEKAQSHDDQRGLSQSRPEGQELSRTQQDDGDEPQERGIGSSLIGAAMGGGNNNRHHNNHSSSIGGGIGGALVGLLISAAMGSGKSHHGSNSSGYGGSSGGYGRPSHAPSSGGGLFSNYSPLGQQQQSYGNQSSSGGLGGILGGLTGSHGLSHGNSQGYGLGGRYDQSSQGGYGQGERYDQGGYGLGSQGRYDQGSQGGYGNQGGYNQGGYNQGNQGGYGNQSQGSGGLGGFIESQFGGRNSNNNNRY